MDVRSRRNAVLFVALSLLLALPTCEASAQTLPSGVIDAPPTVIGDNESIGSNTTLNVLDGGTVGENFFAGLPDGSSTDVLVEIGGGVIGRHFRANAGSTVNIRGGSFGFFTTANSGSTVNVSGGFAGDGFVANAGSTVNVAGGILGSSFKAREGSNVTISGGRVGPFFRTLGNNSVEFVGGDFRLNGSPYSDAMITLAAGDVFTGAFADGTPFLFESGDPNNLEDSPELLIDVALTPTTLPAIDLSPIIIDGSGSIAPAGLRAGQTLTLRDTGTLGRYFAATDATLHIEGGTVPQSSLEVAGSTVNITGGFVEAGMSAHLGSTINIQGGTTQSFRVFSGSVANISDGVATGFFVGPGGVVNVSGGEVQGRAFFNRVHGVVSVSGGEVAGFTLEAGSSANITGGTVDHLLIESGSSANISGGAFGLRFGAASGSTTHISGGTFGALFNARTGSTELVGGEFRLNGASYNEATITLADDDVLTGTLADGSPFVFHHFASDPFGSRGSDRLEEVVLTTSALPSIDTTPQVIDSLDDQVPSGLRSGQTLTLREGAALGDSFAAVDAVLNIEGGEVGRWLEVVDSVVNLSGGNIEDGFRAGEGSTVNIYGGTFKGEFFDSFNALAGSTINLIGTNFVLNGTTVDIELRTPIEITDRDVVLTGQLANGELFEFDLNSTLSSIGDDFFSPESMLTLTLLPEPGDFNGDGLVDATDEQVWRTTYGETVIPFSGADGNGNGVIDAADYTVWRDNVTNNPPRVPEPTAGVLLLIAAAANLLPRRRA